MSTQSVSFSILFGRDGGTVVVRIAGDLDVATAPQLEHGLSGLIDGQGNLSIRVELGEVTFIDSIGLTTLVRALRQVRDRGGDLVLANPTPTTLRVLELVGLTQVFRITADEPATSVDDCRPSVAGR